MLKKFRCPLANDLRIVANYEEALKSGIAKESKEDYERRILDFLEIALKGKELEEIECATIGEVASDVEDAIG